jgi:hypothetical protein
VEQDENDGLTKEEKEEYSEFLLAQLDDSSKEKWAEAKKVPLKEAAKDDDFLMK